MQKLSSSKRAAKPAAVATVADADTVATVTVPVDVPATVTVAKPDPVAVAADRITARDAANVARYATHYSTTSIRDDAYRASFALAANGADGFTMRQLHDAGVARGDGPKRYNRFYTGSAKATDVGALNRARQAGDIVPTNADCTAFAFTAVGAERCRAELAKRTAS
jgi:hypothetical protein